MLQLKHILDETSIGGRKLALASLPNTLEEAYADVITRIGGSKKPRKDLARKTLSWLLYARRPLTMAELREAVAIEDGYRDLTEFLSHPNDIVECCCSLIDHERTTDIVQFSHYTVVGFLLNTDYFLPRTYLAKTCLTYLLFDVFEAGPCCNEAEFESLLERYKFAKYVSQYWDTYVQGLGEDDPHVRNLLFRFLASHCKREAMLDLFRNCHYFENGGYQNLPALHILARVGFVSICKSVLVNENANLELYLSGANLESTESEMLLSEFRDIAALDKYGDTALHYAARAGHEDIVVLLLKKGANIDAQNYNSDAPLHFASSNGHECAVRVLLEEGANICLKNAQGLTALHLAANFGNTDIVLTLLQAERKLGGVLNARCDEYIEKLQHLPLGTKKNRTLLFLVSLHPTDHIYATFLGNSLWEKKMLKKAIEFYNMGLRLNPSNSTVTRLEDMHQVAVCDSCYETIIGVRHRCVLCSDFDLCSSCNLKAPKWHAQLRHQSLAIPEENWDADCSSMHYKNIIQEIVQMERDNDLYTVLESFECLGIYQESMFVQFSRVLLGSFRMYIKRCLRSSVASVCLVVLVLSLLSCLITLSACRLIWSCHVFTI